MSMQPYFEPRERRIQTRDASKCGNCGHLQHDHEPEFRCFEQGCNTWGCATCITVCDDCGGRFCWGHMVRSFDVVSSEQIRTCHVCMAMQLHDKAEAEFDAKVVAA